jgi:alkylation response protein AidB-like acyl-CoA dehydrogenase
MRRFHRSGGARWRTPPVPDVTFPVTGPGRETAPTPKQGVAPMDHELQPVTKAGRRFVELAEEHAAGVAERAQEHDRDGTFPFEAFESMKASGFMAATVPEAFGGLGLDSAHDLGVGLNRLARGDGSVAIAANMHLAFGLIGTRLARGAREAGDDEGAAATETLLGMVGGGAIAMANATEGGTDLRHPLTEATPVEDGWTITGRKIFGTLSPIADFFFVPARIPRDDGSYGMGFAFVFRGTPGQQILDNWDALGMRASGSNDVVYENCVVPEALFTVGEEDWGQEGELSLIVATAGNIGLVASFLGIAEAARDITVEMATTRKKAPSGRVIGERAGIQRLVAEIDVDLSTSRALLHRAGEAIDDVITRPVADVGVDDLHQLNKEFQAAKLVVNRAAIDVVDRALTVSGGAGYLTGSRLSRLYRDVRAGPFMQPHSPVEVHEYIGKIALGLPPVLET